MQVKEDLGILGVYNDILGDIFKAIEYYEQALIIARELKDHESEGKRVQYWKVLVMLN